MVDAVEEDESFTHTLIEMFMVEANEAVARELDSHNLAFLRRTHPGRRRVAQPRAVGRYVTRHERAWRLGNFCPQFGTSDRGRSCATNVSI